MLMITVIRQVLRRLLSRMFHCCEFCGGTAIGEFRLRKVGMLIFNSVYICQSCQKNLWEFGRKRAYVVDKKETNYSNDKKVFLKRKKG